MTLRELINQALNIKYPKDSPLNKEFTGYPEIDFKIILCQKEIHDSYEIESIATVNLDKEIHLEVREL